MLRAWRGEHGDWCPGYGRPAHRAADLTVDHVTLLAAGGAPFDIANTAVLCRSCNSTKGASTASSSMTSALHWPFESWGRFLPEHTTAVAFLDRLLHAVPVATSGDSYRMKEALTRGGGPSPIA